MLKSFYENSKEKRLKSGKYEECLKLVVGGQELNRKMFER